MTTADASFEAGRDYQNKLCIPKLRQHEIYFDALLRISEIKNVIPWDAADAATECIRIAKQAIRDAEKAANEPV